VRRAGFALAALGALAACEATPPSAPQQHEQTVVSAVPPPPRPAKPAADLAALRRERAEAARLTEAAEPGPASRSMAAYLRGAQEQLIARNKLRAATEAEEATVTPVSLARDFVQVALHDEYVRDNGGLSPRATPAPLRRWRDPVRMQLVFGDSVPIPDRVRDRATVADVAARLSRATGHPVSLSGGGGNFLILVMSEDERSAIGPRLRSLLPGIPATDIAAIRDLPPQNFCSAFAYSRDGASTYAEAVAVIRAELPDRLRRSCFHEELAQGMGLANDSPGARPSIFNDDEEFAFLTRHDEHLLKMLYDPRLRPGMLEAEAAPIAAAIAAELVGP